MNTDTPDTRSTIRTAEETFELKAAALIKRLDSVRREAEREIRQVQATVLAVDFEKQLQENFPGDVMEVVQTNGFSPGVRERVIAADGLECGTILWELKGTQQSWFGDWPSALRDDRRAAQANIVALAGSTSAKDCEEFRVTEGVFVVRTEGAMPVARALRRLLDALARRRLAQDGGIDAANAPSDAPETKDLSRDEIIEATVDAFLPAQRELADEYGAIFKRCGIMSRTMYCLIESVQTFCTDQRYLFSDQCLEFQYPDMQALEAETGLSAAGDVDANGHATPEEHVPPPAG